MILVFAANENALVRPVLDAATRRDHGHFEVDVALASTLAAAQRDNHRQGDEGEELDDIVIFFSSREDLQNKLNELNNEALENDSGTLTCISHGAPGSTQINQGIVERGALGRIFRARHYDSITDVGQDTFAGIIGDALNKLNEVHDYDDPVQVKLPICSAGRRPNGFCPCSRPGESLRMAAVRGAGAHDLQVEVQAPNIPISTFAYYASGQMVAESVPHSEEQANWRHNLGQLTDEQRLELNAGDEEIDAAFLVEFNQHIATLEQARASLSSLTCFNMNNEGQRIYSSDEIMGLPQRMNEAVRLGFVIEHTEYLYYDMLRRFNDRLNVRFGEQNPGLRAAGDEIPIPVVMQNRADNANLQPTINNPNAVVVEVDPDQNDQIENDNDDVILDIDELGLDLPLLEVHDENQPLLDFDQLQDRVARLAGNTSVRRAAQIVESSNTTENPSIDIDKALPKREAVKTSDWRSMREKSSSLTEQEPTLEHDSTPTNKRPM